MRKRRAIAACIVLATIVACLGPALTESQQETIVVQPGSTYNFGVVNVGSNATKVFTLSPASGSMSSVDMITAITETCPAFSLQLMAPLPGSPATVERNCGSGSSTTMSVAPATENETMPVCSDTTYMFQATFAPTLAGSASCTVQITGTSSSTLFLSGVGQAMTLALDLTPPANLPFGDIRVGNNGTQLVQIRNSGTSPVTINSITASPAVYTLVGTLGSHVIQPGITEMVQVTCTPANGANPGTFTVNSNAGNKTLVMSCNGITSDFVVNPSPIDVTTRVGETKDKDVVITNMGSAAGTIGGLSIVPTVASIPITIVPPTKTPPFTIGVGSSETVRIRFAPTMPQATTELAKLRIGEATMRDVLVNGAALETSVVVNPDTVNFGVICAGTTEMRDVEIKAGSPGPFQLMSIDAPAGPFMLRPKPGTMVPGNAMGNAGNKLEFTAIASATGSGMISAKAVLHTDAPSERVRDLSFMAEVLPGGVGASPATVDFGGILKNTTSPAMRTVVRNCGDSALAISDVHFEGIDKADFTVVSPADPLLALQPQEEVEYLIVMRSDKPGAKTATLVIASASGVATTIQIVGTALGSGTGDGDLGGPTYYTCHNCSSGSAGWLVVVVAAGLRRRRRHSRK